MSARLRAGSLLVAGSVLVGTFGAIHVCNREPAAVSEAASASSARTSRYRSAPISIPILRLPLLAVDPEQWRSVVDAFQPAFEKDRKDQEEQKEPRNGTNDPLVAKWATNPSTCLHCLRLRGIDTEFGNRLLPNSRAVLDALTTNAEASRVFGAPLLFRTRSGVRYRARSLAPERWSKADEAHLDQIVASLFELGIPLDTRLELGDAVYSLTDVLDDCVANFDLAARELEWTAVALALTLPPRKSWTNRYGETTTFDMLAQRLLDRAFRGKSCAGTHVFYAMTILWRAHEACRILSDKVEKRLRDRIVHLVERLGDSQYEDGAWDYDWYLKGSLTFGKNESEEQKAATIRRRILVTGHIGECILRLPEDLRPPEDQIRRAGSWLWPRVREAVANNILVSRVCPLTHACCVVQALIRDGRPR